MNERVLRTPVTDPLPFCYTLHRGDDTCAECPHRVACARASEDNAGRKTVRQAADAAVAAYRVSRGEASPEPEDLIRLAAQVCGASTRATRHWLMDRAWRAAFTVVVASCARAGWDTRTYVRAIAETVGAYAIKNGWSVTPGMFVGDKAVERFERWARRNQRIHNDAHADRKGDREREQLLAGECCFAERFLADPDATVEEAEAFARASFPGWSLACSDGRDDLRLPALAGALASVDPGLPHRVLVPQDGWTWPDARAALLELTRLEDDDAPERPDLDPELGDLL